MPAESHVAGGNNKIGEIKYSVSTDMHLDADWPDGWEDLNLDGVTPIPTEA